MAILIFLFLCLFFPSSVLATSSIKINGYSATGTEYVELINTSSIDVSLEGWSIKDDNNRDDDISLTSTDTISANSTKQFFNKDNPTWLNNDKDIIYLYDNLNNQVDKLSYPLPTNTPIPPTSTPILTPTNTPTPDPTIINPDSGISLNEFMPYGSTTDKEWVELFNNNDKPVKLVAWKIMDSNSGTKPFDLSIMAKSYGVVEFSSGFLNNDGDKIILINNNGKEIDKHEYSGNNYSLDYSWSLVSGNWCRAEISKGSLNNQNCYQTPTLVPTSGPTATPTSDPTKYITDESATASAIIEPTTESAFLSPTDDPQPTSTNNDTGSVLGDANTSSTGKKNYFALILISLGALLLASPIIIKKVKEIKSRQ